MLISINNQPVDISSNVAGTLRRFNQVTTLPCGQAMLWKLIAAMLLKCCCNVVEMLLQCYECVDNQHYSDAAATLLVEPLATLQLIAVMLWQLIAVMLLKCYCNASAML